MTVVIGILALIGLAVVGAIGWAFAHGVRDGLAQWREAPPGGMSQPLAVGEPPLSLSAVLPSSYQAGQLAGEVAASWRSAHQAARATAPGVPASSSWAAALALGSELSQQRQEAGRAMQAAMAQVLQDNEQAVREAAAEAAGGRRDTSNGGSGASSGGGVTDESSGNGVSADGGAAPTATGLDEANKGGSTPPDARAGVTDSGDSNGTAEAAARPTWPAYAPQRRPPRPRPRRCAQHRPTRSDERQS